ncbi:MAG: hypothetical protein SVR04_14675 [Spirochaetota bacterium]|nr:hypothetical protein [Spirochaetota bacterium]
MRRLAEIPVAQTLLGTMNLKDTIVSFDAMNTQIETLTTIVERKGYYIGGLKGNHQTMLEECAFCFDDAYMEKARKDPRLHYSYVKKAHNQIETMDAKSMSVPSKSKTTITLPSGIAIKPRILYIVRARPSPR